MQILLENNVTHFTKYYDNVDVENGTIYFKTEIDTSMLVDGEYTLYLLDNVNKVISKELVRLGNFNKNEYKLEKKFTQYVRK